ncbi:ABC transporter ATP-binding protein [Komagataeibacter intermedius]|nr:ABC transporter ATP-binding protein [Komagataeibacter intermedius]
MALVLDNITKSFHQNRVVDNLDLTVHQGQAIALIGPNGAGKTTVFNLISGIYPLDQGRIYIDGTDVTNISSGRRIRAGVARSFQNVRLMPYLSVMDNLLLGQHLQASGVGTLLAPFRLMPHNRWREAAREALETYDLTGMENKPVGALPYGIRKRVDLVRATLTGARLLLLDEPAAGLNPSETNALRQHLDRMRIDGMTLVVIEHDMGFIERACDHVVVLNFGAKIAEGTLAQVQRNPLVQQAYIGTTAQQEVMA